MPSFNWWNSEGLIPHELDSPDLPNRSPYRISLDRLIRDFGQTQTRRALLADFLAYRASLHQIGIVQGFQWINGSFVENIEQTEVRAPNDIDVVTFFHMPCGYTEESLLYSHQAVLDHYAVRLEYSIDAYYVCLDVEDYYATYSYNHWNSFWSQDRYGRRKGYLEIDLSDDEDENALTIIGASIV